MSCFLNSQITKIEQNYLTVENKIILSANFSSSSLVEGSSFSLGLSLDTESSADTLVEFSISGGTSGLTRFSSAPASATIIAGTKTTSIAFVSIDDLTVHGNETFSVQILNAQKNIELKTTSISFTVLENDVAPLPSVTVSKTYPTSGAKWLSFVKGNNGGTRFFNQPDVACDSTETGSTEACIHGGDKLKVVVTGYTSCSGLTTTDYLAAFDWLCAIDGGVATFFSIGLKTGKGLSDLIDFTNNDWLNNFVTVKLNNTAIMASSSAKWWNTTTENPIAPAPDSSSATQVITGFPAGTILTIQNSVTSHGFNIDQDSIGFVVKNGSTLTYGGNANNCNESTGETAVANFKILVCSGGQKYLWIEGSVTGAGGTADHIIAMSGAKFSRINKVRIAEGGADVAMLMIGSDYNKVIDVEVKGSTGYGIFWIENSNYNMITKFKGSFMRSPVTYTGLNLESNCNHNILQDIDVNNWDARAIQMNGNNNILGKALVTNSATVEIKGQNPIAHHITSSNNSSSGLSIDSATNAIINQIYSHQSNHEIFISNSNNSVVSQIAVKRIIYYSVGFGLDTTNGTKFTNNILIDDDNNSSNRCTLYNNSGANPGLVAVNCGNANSSNANWVFYPFATASPLIGLATSDSVNAHGSSGTITWSSITDWLNFENPFRAWSSQTQGQCNSGSCVLVDYRIRTGDGFIKNRSGDGSTVNDAFVSGATCPAAVHGNKTIADFQPSPRIFLVNALEIYGDGIGNDNTLCESNEECIYSPNFGVYQGEGDYKSNGTCTFQNGNVSNVTIYSYPTNGG
tara:strand:+ start:15184 stop:17580 length:2397 start_codon:yes stop_codon:yes gene_type:complete